MGFVHLHLHSEYSLLDGACRIGKLVDAVKENGQGAVAVTDHGVMYGAVEFYKAAKKAGIKPIIGCEVYVAPRTRFDKVYSIDNEYRHLVLLCENQLGYQNLIKIVSRSFTEGFYFKPRVDLDLLNEYHEGLIALSACLAGEIPHHLVNDDYNAAKEAALRYDKIFGHGNFFIELQNHGIEEQLRILPLLKRLSSETDIPMVATNDAHYINKSDADMQKVLICIQTNKTVDEENPLAFKTDEFYLKSSEEMSELFSDVPQAIENTGKIADRCNVEFEFGKTKLPLYDIGDKDHYEYFRDMCYSGLKKRYDSITDKLTDRLEYELGVINQMGYVDYFLIVQDYVNYAKDNGIPVGPGRGSGAGSLCAYCVGITDIDPIKHDLIFERFLNPERVSMPDFDVDFCYVRRQEVIDYVVKKYGADHVAQIVTFGTMAAKAAVRDVARALGYPYAVGDKISKLIPNELNITLEKALKESADFKQLYDNDPDAKRIIDMSEKVEGMPRHASKHAAGVVITRNKVDDYVPLALNDNAVVTQFTMTLLEELGLLKMDFLGLRNLTIIDDAEKMIRRYDPDFKIENIPLDDKATYALFSSGKTDGVFQFESPGMKRVLTQLIPENIEDLIAVISLYRPGPMDSIPKYLANRHNKNKIEYATPQLEHILDVTYGCLVYQEQVMQVFRDLSGYSYGRSDIVRRAMSKKKHDVMEKERNSFIYGDDKCDGCVKRGIPAEIANGIFDDMSSFASYAFNKSHAAAYAYIAYRTAYLKCHYKREYMAALLSSIVDSPSKISKYISECHSMGIDVLPPDVNSSDKEFTVSDGVIRFGLLAIKNLGNNLIDRIVESRNTDGEFKSLLDFCERLYGNDLNTRAVESLIKCGAFDSISQNRRQLVESVESIIGYLDKKRKNTAEGQISLFDGSENENESLFDFNPPQISDYDQATRLSFEKEYTGLYMSGHPMREYLDTAVKAGCTKLSDILDANDESSEFKDGDSVKILVMISAIKTRITKSNQTMGFLTCEDATGEINVLVFPNTLTKYSNLCVANNIVIINGKLSLREDRSPEIVCSDITTDLSGDPAKVAEEKPHSKYQPGLYIRIPSLESDVFKQSQSILKLFGGITPVYIFCMDSGKRLVAPNKLWISANELMLNELKSLLGDENVKYIS